MIQIGIPELLIILLVFFVAAKPEKISKYLRDLMKSFIKIRSTFDNAKEDLEREFNYQELKARWSCSRLKAVDTEIHKTIPIQHGQIDKTKWIDGIK